MTLYTSASATTEPVFLDRSGRRHRIVVRAGAVGGAVLVVAVLALLAGFTGVGPGPVSGWSGPARRATTVAPAAGASSPRPRPAVAPATTRSRDPGPIPSRSATPSPSSAAASAAVPTTPTPSSRRHGPGNKPWPRHSKKK